MELLLHNQLEDHTLSKRNVRTLKLRSGAPGTQRKQMWIERAWDTYCSY